MSKKTITKNELVELLQTLDGNAASFVTIFSVTDPRMTKKDRQTGEPNPWHGKAYKLTILYGNLNVEYEKTVNNQRKRERRERNFKSEGRKYGYKKDANGCVIYDNGQPKYLALQPIKAKSIICDFEGTFLSKNVLGDVLPKKSKSQKQGTDKEVPYINYKINNIRKIRIFGTTYRIK